MTAPRASEAVLEQEFLPLRARILEIAAGLDRLDRSIAAEHDDGRRERLLQAIGLLLENEPNRAEQVQLLFSREYDDNWRREFGV